MLYKWLYKRLKTKGEGSIDEIYLLSDEEVGQVKRTERNTIVIAALTGALMVLALYFPQYFLPHLFPTHTIWIPIYGQAVELPLVATVYGVFLVFIEIWILTALNIFAAHKVADAIGFITHATKDSAVKRKLLLSLSQNKKTKDIKHLGIDPYQGISSWQVFLMNLFFALKATLSNLVVKMVVQRFLGRFAVREVLDMLGVPIFAFWNALAAKQVLMQSRIILMGQNYLLHFERELKAHEKLSETEKTLLYQTLQIIAMSKRDFHRNHYYLSKLVMEVFEIETKAKCEVEENYAQQIADATPSFKALNEKILILGFIMDGSVSLREKLKISKMNEDQLLIKTEDEIEALAKQFVLGKGV